jgi:hypothetical protein|tara:strand:- start:324 stop:623 length:300 start_codon:yes stop_codon:yes gene_type:complete
VHPRPFLSPTPRPLPSLSLAQDNHAHEDEVSLWHEFFVAKAEEIGDERCLVFAHRGKLAATADGGPSSLPLLKRSRVVTSDRDSAALIRRSFAEFVQTI